MNANGDYAGNFSTARAEIEQDWYSLIEVLLMALYIFIPIMWLDETAFFGGFSNITCTLQQPN